MPQRRVQEMVKNKNKNHLSGRLDKDLGTITWGEDAAGKMILTAFAASKHLKGVEAAMRAERGLRRI